MNRMLIPLYLLYAGCGERVEKGKSASYWVLNLIIDTSTWYDKNIHNKLHCNCTSAFFQLYFPLEWVRLISSLIFFKFNFFLQVASVRLFSEILAIISRCNFDLADVNVELLACDIFEDKIVSECIF